MPNSMESKILCHDQGNIDLHYNHHNFRVNDFSNGYFFLFFFFFLQWTNNKFFANFRVSLSKIIESEP